VPEWLIGTVLKTVDWLRQSVGSNPTPSAFLGRYGQQPTEDAAVTHHPGVGGTIGSATRAPMRLPAAGVAEWQTLRT
jgi:hypothetical protein